MDTFDVRLDRAGETSLYEQLVDAVAGAIASGELHTGERLPSERDLAEDLGVSRTTTVNAYRELEARGLVRRQVGRGTVVCADQLETDAPFAWRGKIARVAEQTSGPEMRSLVAAAAPGTISFAAGGPALDRFPMETFRRLMDDVLRHDVVSSLGLAQTEGQPQLRRALAARYSVGPEQVLVIAGAQQGLDLVARCLLDPGDAVIMDRPGYLGAIQTFRAAGARLVGWDVVGDDLDALEDLILRHRPKFLYTAPTFQNPTGRTLPAALRQDLVRLAARYRLPIVEDDPYRDLYFAARPPRTLYEMDEHNVVIHLGTFSKTIAPGLRLGWLISSQTIVDQLALVKARTDVFSPGPTQLVMAEMLSSRLFDAHTATMRQEHVLRHDAMVNALKRWMPTGIVNWQPVDGGVYLWCRFRSGIDTQRLLQQALSAGVTFVPGESFYMDRAGRHEARLCFATAPPDAIEEGVRRLAGVLKPGAIGGRLELQGTQPLV